MIEEMTVGQKRERQLHILRTVTGVVWILAALGLIGCLLGKGSFAQGVQCAVVLVPAVGIFWGAGRALKRAGVH